MLVCGQAVFLVPSPTPFPPIFHLLLNLFNMAPEIEFASSDFPPSHKTHSYAGYVSKDLICFHCKIYLLKIIFHSYTFEFVVHLTNSGFTRRVINFGKTKGKFLLQSRKIFLFPVELYSLPLHVNKVTKT